LVVRSGITGAGTEQVEVPGGSLALESLGAGSTLGKPENEVPAEIVFHAGFSMKVRNVGEPEFQAFASLGGALLLQGKERRPVFVCPPEAELVYVEPEPTADDPVRRLLLDFEPASFRGAPAKGSPTRRLRLPAPSRTR
jgi:formylglycine-generating enzyme required for sulfatase activity